MIAEGSALDERPGRQRRKKDGPAFCGAILRAICIEAWFPGLDGL
jgi:hypothetical protein